VEGGHGSGGNVPAAKIMPAELGCQEPVVPGPNTFYELAKPAEKEEQEKNQAHEEGGESYN
jgi:hypothetical protein